MEIKDKIEEIVKKVTTDENLKSRFAKEPVKVVEELLGVDLPEEQIQKVVDGVKAKVSLDKIGSALDGLKKLF